MASPVLPHAKLDWTITKLQERLESSPDDLDARLELSRCLLSRGWIHGGGEKACNEALSLARRVLQDDPTSIVALVIAGASLACMDRSEAAVKYLNQALAAEEERADLQMAFGALETVRGDPGRAVRHYESACRLAPEAWETHLLLGRSLMQLARGQNMLTRIVERAQYHLVRAMQLEPTPDQHPQMLRDMGVCCMITGRTKEAQRFFIRLRENPDHANCRSHCTCRMQGC